MLIYALLFFTSPFLALAQNFPRNFGPFAFPPSVPQQPLEVFRLGGPSTCQRPAKNGDKLEWAYRAALQSGAEFDKGSLSTVLGAGNVIPGVDYGMHGMCVGEQRQIIIPHRYGYGARPPPGSPIPPYATLIFYVTLTKNQAVGKAEDLPEVDIEEIEKVENCEEKAEEGDTVTWKYVGTLKDQENPFDRNSLTATLGSYQVIQGMELGLRGMCVGDKRRITVPPHLGYGDRGVVGVIPPSSTLVFEVEMVNIDKAS